MCNGKVFFTWALLWHVFEGFVIPQAEGVVKLRLVQVETLVFQWYSTYPTRGAGCR